MRKLIRPWLAMSLIGSAALLGVLTGKNSFTEAAWAADLSGGAVTPAATPLTAFNGVRVDLAGKSASASIDLLYAAARTGNAAAAFEIYKIESMCNEADTQAVYFKTLVGMHEEIKKQHLKRISASQSACIGVTPAQKQERLNFLDQAARAGIHDAMFAYRLEGPNGDRLADPSSADPATAQWRETSHAYLVSLAQAGEIRAWSTLALEYANSDKAQAIMYDSAVLFYGNPSIAPLKVNYIAALTVGMTYTQVNGAIEQGRALAAKFPRKSS